MIETYTDARVAEFDAVEADLRKHLKWRENLPMSWGSGRPGTWVGVFVALLALALILRFLAMAILPLVPEEAYYWVYSQHPELSYFDHPPMVAWVIGLGTFLFGDTEFGVRIVGCLMMFGASLMLYRFGRIWFSKEAGLVAALLLQVLPAFFGVGLIATMDSALVFFWMLGLVGMTAALRDSRPWGWYVAGIALGGALLSKYTGIFLALGAGLAVISNPEWRRHLRTPHPYLAFLLALAIFSPVLIWNAQHDWASFRFQFLDRFNQKPFSVVTALEFVGIQFLLVTPVLLLISGRLITSLWQRPFRMPAPQVIMVMAFSLPLLFVMGYKSFKYGVHVNWTVPAFLSLLPAVVQWFVERRVRVPLQHAWSRAMAWTLVTCVAVNIVMMGGLLILQPRVPLFAAFGSWEKLGGIVETYEQQLQQRTGQKPLVIAEGKYRLASVLAFYRNPGESIEYTTSQWIMDGKGLGFPYWIERAKWVGRDCIFVSDGQDALAKTDGHFESVQIMTNVCLPTVGGHHYQIAICLGLR